MLLNLCTNAAQALGTQGRIEVRVTQVALDEACAGRMPPLRAGPHVQLTVKDNGPGIPAAVLPRIFDPFFTTKEVGRGTGLGLAVVQGIARQHRGLVEVESAEGRGAAFHVWLPCTGAEAAAAVERAATPHGKGEHVLVVDDEPALARLTARLLETLGYHVTVKVQAKEALEELRAAPDRFDALVTDLAMPEMPGDALAREAIALRPSLQVILCTGFSEQIGEEDARAAGIQAFLLKPVSRDQLGKVLRRLLDEQPCSRIAGPAR
ncbi:MAG: ATP-binding protein [Myxococcales bacterium]